MDLRLGLRSNATLAWLPGQSLLEQLRAQAATLQGALNASSLAFGLGPTPFPPATDGTASSAASLGLGLGVALAALALGVAMAAALVLRKREQRKAAVRSQTSTAFLVGHGAGQMHLNPVFAGTSRSGSVSSTGEANRAERRVSVGMPAPLATNLYQSPDDPHPPTSPGFQITDYLEPSALATGPEYAAVDDGPTYTSVDTAARAAPPMYKTFAAVGSPSSLPKAALTASAIYNVPRGQREGEPALYDEPLGGGNLGKEESCTDHPEGQDGLYDEPLHPDCASSAAVGPDGLPTYSEPQDALHAQRRLTHRKDELAFLAQDHATDAALAPWWWQDSFSREEAERWLRLQAGAAGSTEGAFLVRSKRGENRYALSVWAKGEVTHHLLEQQGGVWHVNGKAGTDETQDQPLAAVVAWLQKHRGHSLPCRLATLAEAETPA
jgi:hypothetical protein